ncbi:hypothetical protein GpartN1_g1942.t1 [Galdieria partita]|uniref:Deoxyuridine 5'-triphosphate nucleotidohydrolase n=1 Tax=Galdieria partita TaxID=83374 RepID=A0A9C7UP39_9RHOD|nr:hypothetical protein GpartN1_g1942.t1 [Galdieria partita]
MVFLRLGGKAIIMKIKLLHREAVIPRKATTGSVGYDLSSVEDVSIEGWSRSLVKTGISIRGGIPEGCYLRIAPRSGLALKNGIHIGAGVVDRDYRGEIGIVVFNLSNDLFEVRKGQRIAQLIVERVVEDIEVMEEEGGEETHEEHTDRGHGGFGSTD